MKSSYIDTKKTAENLIAHLRTKSYESHNFRDGILVIVPTVLAPLKPLMDDLLQTIATSISSHFDITIDIRRPLYRSNSLIADMQAYKGFVISMDWDVLRYYLEIPDERTTLVSLANPSQARAMGGWTALNSNRFVAVIPDIGKSFCPCDVIFWSLNMEAVCAIDREINHDFDHLVLESVVSQCGTTIPWGIFFDLCMLQALMLSGSPENSCHHGTIKREYCHSLFEIVSLFTTDSDVHTALVHPPLGFSGGITDTVATTICNRLKSNTTGEYASDQTHVANLLMHFFSGTTLCEETDRYWKDLRYRVLENVGHPVQMEGAAIDNLYTTVARLNPYLLLNKGQWIFRLAEKNISVSIE